MAELTPDCGGQSMRETVAHHAPRVSRGAGGIGGAAKAWPPKPASNVATTTDFQEKYGCIIGNSLKQKCTPERLTANKEDA